MSSLRHNARTDRTSTFEAIAQALGILEGPEIADALLRFFRQVLERVTYNSRRRKMRHGGCDEK
jgi:DTW domain-containing protein YfiP